MNRKRALSGLHLPFWNSGDALLVSTSDWYVAFEDSEGYPPIPRIHADSRLVVLAKAEFQVFLHGDTEDTEMRGGRSALCSRNLCGERFHHEGP